MAGVASSVSSSDDLVSLDSVDWGASLPSDVIFLILDKLFESTDHVRFSAVCKGWNSLTQDYHTHSPWRSRTLVPMLMILKNQPEETHREAVLYSVSEDRSGVYNSFKFQIPRISRYHYGTIEGSRYSGGHGWLARVVFNPVDPFHNLPKPTKLCITLLNPFRSQGTSSIALPNFLLGSESRYLNKWKVVLSGDPTLNPDNYVVILLCWYYDSVLAFFTGGQKSWTRLSYSTFTDAIFYRGRGYAFKWGKDYGAVTTFSVEISDTSKQGSKYTRQWRHDNHEAGTAYLVESTQGDLLCVRRYFKLETSTTGLLWRTERFTVSKLVLDDKNGSVESQVEVESIGDDALFLGNSSQSVSVLASKHPGCRPNCIYYTDDLICKNYRVYGHEYDDTVPLDMGIFNMEDQTITQLRPQISWNEHVLRPLWITPTFSRLSLVSSN